MSYFDPYSIYKTTRKRSTHNAQVLQKKPVDPSFALTNYDLKRAIDVMKSYHYYFTKSSPKYLTVPFTYYLENTQTNDRIDIAFDLMFSNLHNYVRTLMISQYNNIFNEQYTGVQFLLLLNSFQGYFKDSSSSTNTGSINYYISNRLTCTLSWQNNENFNFASLSSIDADLLDYSVTYARDNMTPMPNFSRKTGDNNSLIPGVLQGYNFQNPDEIFNYFKDTNPLVNPFSTSNQLGMYSDVININATRIIVQFTLNIFITYFFLFFSFLF